MIAHITATSTVNANRDTKKHPQPFLLPAPWLGEGKDEEVTPEERAKLRARLLRHSAFAE
jgi:hypothetical protein